MPATLAQVSILVSGSSLRSSTSRASPIAFDDAAFPKMASLSALSRRRRSAPSFCSRACRPPSPRTSLPAQRGAQRASNSSDVAAIRRTGIGRGKLLAVDPVRRAGASPRWPNTAVWRRRARLVHRICLQSCSGIWEHHRPFDTVPSLYAYGTDRRRGRRNVGVRDRDVYDRASSRSFL